MTALPGFYLGDHRILTVTARNDRFYLDTRDIMLTPGVLCWGSWEPETVASFERLLKPGMHWADIGANIGYFTIVGHRLAMGSGGHTYAFEANPRTFEFLRDNINLNWFFDGCTAEHKAVYSRSQMLDFSAPEKFNVNASIATFEPGAWDRVLDKVTTFQVQGVSLDEYFAERRLDFCKVDVEGAEYHVLAGGRQVIARNPELRMLIEWSPQQMLMCGSSAPALADLIEELGLECRRNDTDVQTLTRGQLLDIQQTTMVLLQHRRGG